MNTTLKQAFNLYRFFSFEIQGNADLSESEVYEVKDAINDIIERGLTEKYSPESFQSGGDYFEEYEILETCLEATDSDFNDLEFYEFIELIEELNDLSADNWIDSLPCGEVRIIHEDDVDQIWEESLIEQIKECYDLSNVPSFVEIDWQATAENCKIDGKGHHFGTYDGYEHYSNGFYIFRTN